MIKHDGAKMWPQRFPEKSLLRWKMLLNDSPEMASCLEVWDASSIGGQLAATKKIAANIQKSSLLRTLSPIFLQVLVEAHAFCSSRHPLQRSIASILQDLQQSYGDMVSNLIYETLVNVMNGLVLDKLSMQLQYIQSLLENFILGESVLLNSLPQLLEFFDSQFEITLSGGSMVYDDLILVMKTLMNLLYKCSNIEVLSVSSSIHWPQALQGQTVPEKVIWIKMKLSSLQIKAESTLFSGTVSHDVILSCGMLCTVLLVLIASNSTASVEVLQSKVQSWLCRQDDFLFTQLALCHSLLAKVPCAHLLGVMINGTSLLLSLFPTICDLFGRISETPDRYLAARTLALWASVAKECSTASVSLAEVLHPDGKIIPTLLQFVWTLWEDPVNGIRHQCQSIFMDIIAAYEVLESGTSQKYLLSLLECLLHMKNSTRGKYTLLSLLSRHVNVHDVLRLHPELPQELMNSMGHQALACHAGDIWCQLVKLHWSSDGATESWKKIWIETLVRALNTMSPLARQHIAQHCLSSVFECDEDSLSYIENSLSQLEVSSETKLMTLLTCLRAARTVCKDFKFEEKYSVILVTAMHHGDEQVQLSILGLICESRRTTELPHPAALSLVLQFLHLNGSTQSTGFRYDIVTCIRKLLLRIRDGCYGLLKQQKKKHEIELYKEFLNNLMMQQFEALHPLSAFQRREIALLVLSVMQSTFTCDSPQTSPSVFVFTDAVSTSCLHCLVFSMLDSYSANKSAALDITLKFPKGHVQLQNEFFRMIVERFFELVRSPKATDCSSAAHLLSFLIYHDGSHFNCLLLEIVGKHRMNNGGLLVSTADIGSPIFSINILLEILCCQLMEAETNLLTASVSSPMYGVIQSIHTALEKIDLSCWPINESYHFKTAMVSIVHNCKRISSLVSPVVCNSSPEGFLPSNQQSLDPFLVDSSGGNAQSLLLCCWHCMKEISLLLGYIVETASLGEGQILSIEELTSVGDIFIQQLTEARHRGAFEMACNGFTKLCQRLWTSPFSDLKAKTSLWIEELMASLQSTSITKLLNITRRSAGLPFYVQAILVTEPKCYGFQCFHNTMEVLLTIAESWNVHPSLPLEENQSFEVEPSAVHALNILRALYRDSILGQRIVPYIPRGMMVAIDGFSAKFWPIRNSSTMLLSAIMTRIFGVKKVQDERSPENKTTAMEFFTRFPTLRECILKKLEIAVTAMSNSESMLQPSLFPILLILSHLYPSPVDNLEAVEYMESFLPPLLRCTRSPVWKTRELVSYAVLSTVPGNKWNPVVMQIVELLNGVHQNQTHGLLLVLSRLLFDHPEGRHELACVQNIVSILSSLLAVRNLSSWMNNCFITQCCYVQIIIGLLKLVPHDFNLQLRVPCLPLFVQRALPLLYQVNNKNMFQAGFFATVSELLLLLVSNTSGWNILEFHVHSQLLEECCNHTEVKVRKYAITVLRSLPTEHANYIERIVLPLLCSESNDDVLLELYLTAVYVISSKNSFQNNDLLHQGVSRALGMLQCIYGRIELKMAQIQFISYAISHITMCLKEKFNWMEILNRYGSESNAVELRQTVAHAMKQLWILVKDDSYLVQYYWMLTFNLLQDPVDIVRNEMAKSISTALSNEMISYPGYGANPCPPAALKWAVQAMVQFHLKDLHTSIDILISQMELIPSTKASYQNILFDEDPVNTFAEQWIVIQVIIGALCSVQHPTTELQYHLESLFATSLQCIEKAEHIPAHTFTFTNLNETLLLLKSLIVVYMYRKDVCIEKCTIENMHPLMQKYINRPS